MSILDDIFEHTGKVISDVTLLPFHVANGMVKITETIIKESEKTMDKIINSENIKGK